MLHGLDETSFGKYNPYDKHYLHGMYLHMSNRFSNLFFDNNMLTVKTKDVIF
jgi:hypothetical protein